MEYDIRVATAEPMIPYFGIRIRFRPTFKIIPTKFLLKDNLVKFSLIKYWLLATPRKTATPAQMYIVSIGEADENSFPNKS